MFLTAFTLLFAFLGNLLAPQGNAKALTDQQLEIATGEYAPLTGAAFPDGGPVTAIVTAALGHMKKDFKVVYVPWKRADDGVRKGNYWAAFPYVKSPDREQHFLFSAPLTKTPTRFFVRKDSPSSMENQNWWKGKILCRPAGYEATLLAPIIEKLKLQIENPLTLESCYMMLKAKKVDVIPNPEIVGRYYIDKIFGTDADFKTLNDYINEQTFHVIVNRQAPKAAEFISEFNRTLQKMQQSGEYQRIYERSSEQVKKLAKEKRAS